MKKDFSGIEKIKVNLAELGQDKDIFMFQVLEELAGMFLAEVKRRTPVGEGTYEVVGRYKRGKNKGKPKLKKISQGGTLRRAWHIKNITKHGDFYIVSVFNNMEYASYVENGHRQHVGQYVPVLGKRLKKSFVEGKFMMKLSAELIKKEGKAYIRQEFETFLRRHWNG